MQLHTDDVSKAHTQGTLAACSSAMSEQKGLKVLLCR